MSEHGLPPDSTEITDAAVRQVIAEYTREAGVRTSSASWARCVGRSRPAWRRALPTCRRRRKPSSTASRSTSTSAPRDSRKRWRSGRRDPESPPASHGTETGGDVLFIEATLLPGGNQNIILTGQLGNVMQESARVALSHLRARATELGISPEFLPKHDLQLHVPAGAIPKDGPSAGVTMATAILSAARNRPVREDVAMTGEITLSGLVLPVGGIRRRPWQRGGSASRRSASCAQRTGPRGLAGGAPPGHDVRAGETLDQVVKVAMTEGVPVH